MASVYAYTQTPCIDMVFVYAYMYMRHIRIYVYAYTYSPYARHKHILHAYTYSPFQTTKKEQKGQVLDTLMQGGNHMHLGCVVWCSMLLELEFMLSPGCKLVKQFTTAPLQRVLFLSLSCHPPPENILRQSYMHPWYTTDGLHVNVPLTILGVEESYANPTVCGFPQQVL